MKHTFITTITPGYMFALNCNFNANKYYGTNADFHILYHPLTEKDYMDRCEKAFPFQIKWIPMNDFGTFHTAKYAYAKKLIDYDSVCLIDADLFICSNVLEYFEKAAQEDILISATHVWSGGDVEQLPFDDPDKMTDRGLCQLADFPVFINPRRNEKFFDDWINGTLIDISKEISHPLVSFNRAVCRNFKLNQILPLSGYLWVCDSDYWVLEYIRQNDIISNGLGDKVFAIHNKWWKAGRSSGEWEANRNMNLNDANRIQSLDRGQNNFNTIRDFMSWFNDMTIETKREDFFKDKHNWRSYLGVTV